MKTVIILGNARSGTSMVSGIVHHLGINMRPKDNPSVQNPKIRWLSRSTLYIPPRPRSPHR